MIAAVVAVDKNYLIGDSNSETGLPWSYPEDLAFFKKLTTNKTVVMGASTFDAIGRVLPNRKNIVVTKEPEKYKNIEGLEIATDLKELMESFTEDDEVFIIGGASIYKQTEKYLDFIYMTFIQEEYHGDIYFPEYNWKDFEMITRGFRDKLIFTTLKRINYKTDSNFDKKKKI